MKKVLLIEPDYKNKYPPLGLMKISQFHKSKGHEVVFYKGLSPELRGQQWNRIYIATLFTFYWNKTIQTIRYYKKSIDNPKHLYIGGVMATLAADEIEKETGIKPISGLLDKPGLLGYKDDFTIDTLVPDYSILSEISYKYPTANSYIAYMTRGCCRNCAFCAVPKIEPVYKKHLSIKKQLLKIDKKYGTKKDLLLLDNNVLASEAFSEIISEILELGFEKGAKLDGRNRLVDFNQGIDARLLTHEKMSLLSKIAIKPLRIAFDNIKDEKVYKQGVRWAGEFGIHPLSNYILFNFKDTPEDFYRRLQINIELNEEFEKKGYKSRIWSFPMKFVPLSGSCSKNRKYVGNHWTRKDLRGIQCVLLATHGVVGPKRAFFEKAFGRNYEEFKEIILMPEDYIIHRQVHEVNGSTQKWRAGFNALSATEKKDAMSVIETNSFCFRDIEAKTSKIKTLLKMYL